MGLVANDGGERERERKREGERGREREGGMERGRQTERQPGERMTENEKSAHFPVPGET